MWPLIMYILHVYWPQFGNYKLRKLLFEKDNFSEICGNPTWSYTKGSIKGQKKPNKTQNILCWDVRVPAERVDSAWLVARVFSVKLSHGERVKDHDMETWGEWPQLFEGGVEACLRREESFGAAYCVCGGGCTGLLLLMSGVGSGTLSLYQVFQENDLITQVWEVGSLGNHCFLMFLTQRLERNEVGGVLEARGLQLATRAELKGSDLKGCYNCILWGKMITSSWQFYIKMRTLDFLIF